MTDAIERTDPPEEDEDTIDEEFQTLFGDVAQQITRLSKIAAAARAENRVDAATMLGELSGTCLQLMSDLVALTGDSFRYLEERIDEVEGGDATVSILLPEDAEKYVACLEQNIRLLTSLINELPDAAEEQKAIFRTLVRMNEDRLAFTREITKGADDDDEDEPKGDA
jgi:geranylgeranyl pyrophosphate synthase